MATSGGHSLVEQAINEVAVWKRGGISDLNILAKYRLTDGEAGFAILGGIKLPPA